MYSTGAGANNGTDKFTRTNLMMQRDSHMNALMCAQSMSSNGFSTDHGDLCQLIIRG